MRSAFFNALCELAARDRRVHLLTADLGFMAIERFRERFPNRFLNVGVAEQNMMGIATGMAEAGLLPFAYTISPFAALRPFEFIRNGPVAHRLPVRIVGMGMGFEYGHAGSTHYGTEDIAALRTLPGLQLVIPADGAQAASALMATAGSGPIYFSLGKDDSLSVPELEGRFEPGRLQVIRDTPSRVALISMGSITTEAAAAANELAHQHAINPKFAVLSSFHPDPVEDAIRFLEGVAHVITIEAQAVSGGLGAFIASVIATRRIPCQLWPIALRVALDGTSGSQSDRWQKYGMDRARIVQTALTAQDSAGPMTADLAALELVHKL